MKVVIVWKVHPTFASNIFLSIVHSFFYFQNGGVQGCSCDGLNRPCRFRFWKILSRENKRIDQKEEKKWLLPKHISGVKGWRRNMLQRYVPHECQWLWLLKTSQRLGLSSKSSISMDTLSSFQSLAPFPLLTLSFFLMMLVLQNWELNEYDHLLLFLIKAFD